MAANNNAPPPQWYPNPEPTWQPGTHDWAKLITEYVWTLRNRQSTLSSEVQNFNNNIAENITKVFNEFNNNGLAGKPPVVYGVHALRLTATYSPVSWTGYVYVETDRFQAAYYSNGTAWVLIGGIGAGSFETRWTGLNSSDLGMGWIETSRNNVSALPPYPNYRWDGNNWAFQSGVFYRTQSALATLAATFAPANASNGNDVGALVNVTDYHHELQWYAFNGTGNANGSTTLSRVSGDLFAANNSWVGFPLIVANNAYSVASVANNNSLTASAAITAGNNLAWSVRAWAWGPHDDLRAGEGPIFREVDPYPLTGWQLYANNANVSYMRSDGALGVVALLPNLSGTTPGNTFIAASNVNSNINAPVQPIFTGNAVSGAVTGTFAGNGTGTANTTSANFTADAGGTPAVVSVNSVAVTVSGNITASFAGNNATGNISNNATPQSIYRRAWFRQ